MNWSLRLIYFLVVGALLLPALYSVAQAPATGAIEFTATVRPTGGRPEPVRDLTFYLLSKSMEEIRSEAEQAEGPIDLTKFIDSLKVSDALKQWMREHDTVLLAGSDFTKLLTADDIIGVPEFFDAYTRHNGAALGAGLPAPKYKESDRESNPERYRREREQYNQVLRKYIAASPESMHGIDAQLADVSPSRQWLQLQAEQRQRVDRRSFELAETEFQTAMTNTDLNGRGSFAGLEPGTYWITTLNTPALAGDVRLRWNVPVSVRPGETTRIELSNLNALESTARTAR
jgi:hypothetical protein